MLLRVLHPPMLQRGAGLSMRSGLYLGFLVIKSQRFDTEYLGCLVIKCEHFDAEIERMPLGVWVSNVNVLVRNNLLERFKGARIRFFQKLNRPRPSQDFAWVVPGLSLYFLDMFTSHYVPTWPKHLHKLHMCNNPCASHQQHRQLHTFIAR